jgi:hypothetical protein
MFKQECFVKKEQLHSKVGADLRKTDNCCWGGYEDMICRDMVFLIVYLNIYIACRTDTDGIIINTKSIAWVFKNRISRRNIIGAVAIYAKE